LGGTLILNGIQELTPGFLTLSLLGLKKANHQLFFDLEVTSGLKS
jgi:hypothetical protein